MIYSVYNNFFGNFIKKINTNTEMPFLPFFFGDETTIEGDYSDDTHWVDVSVTPNVVHTKTASPITHGSLSIVGNQMDTVTFSSVPSGSTFFDPGRNEFLINDGSVIFSVDAPGTFNVQFKHLHYYPTAFDVVAS